MIREELDDAISTVVSKADFIKGTAVEDFEQKLGKYLDDSYVIGVGSGTDALIISLLAMGVGVGDEVIIPGFTYIATAEAVIMVGAKPVLVDIKPNSFNIDSIQIEKAITPSTKAIIPVHMYGCPCDMHEICEIADNHKVAVIEDCAQGLGGVIEVDGISRKVSTIGDLGCLSFFPSKNLGGFGDGGAVVTRSTELAKKVKMIANHGQIKRYHHEIIGFNSRLDSIQAAVLNVKLKYLDLNNRKRAEVAELYSEALKELNIDLPKMNADRLHVYHQYTIVFNNESDRDNAKLVLKEKGIETRVYYPYGMTEHKSLNGKIHEHGDLTNSKKVDKRILSLPIYPSIKLNEIQYIIREIKKIEHK